MQPDLPWNVAGIPPEAREAVRAAARREGLSVGEWLTRRILRSVMDVRETDRPRGVNGDYRSDPDSDWQPQGQSRDTEDMLARVSRSEIEAGNANRKIDEQLKSLGRRLEAAERSQSENNRAMSKAATEINIAAREQAVAFDQLSTHVVNLGDRLSRIERQTGGESVKDAIKGLHAGLSRLADQVAETAHQSASQIASLAGNMEMLAGKLTDSRLESQTSVQALSSRVAEFEQRLRDAEKAADAAAEKLAKALADHRDTLQQARLQTDGESARHAAQLQDLNGGLEKLAIRITTSEAQSAGALARLEEQVARAEAKQNDSPVDRRLQGIEHALSDIAGRLESAERNWSAVAKATDDNLRGLMAKFEAVDARQRESLVETKPASQPVVEAPPAPPPPAPPPPPHATLAAQLDLPPFPEPPPFAPQPPPPPEFAGAAQPPHFAPPPFAGSDPFAPPPGMEPPPTAESFIAAARRSAREAAASDAQNPRGAFGGFSWTPAPASSGAAAEKPNSTRLLFVGMIVVTVGAVVAGILLSRGWMTQPHADLAPPVPRPTVAETVPPPLPQPPQTAAAQPQTAPGSPVIAVRPARIKTIDARPERATTTPLPPGPQTQVSQASQPQAPQHTPTSFERLTALANAGSAKAQLLIGLKYLDGDGVSVNEAEAAKWLERAAKQGEAIAAYRLGTLYERGHGVPADPAKAAQWYTDAARLGNRKAMHNLAVAYAQGTGVAKDLTQAAQWFSKAAGLGLADSEFNLAVLYERGMGVQQSLIDAYKWYAVAAAQGDSESKARLEVIATQLNPDERVAAQRAAAEFRPLPLDPTANVPPDPSMVN